jgi:hypothetical protein
MRTLVFVGGIVVDGGVDLSPIFEKVGFDGRRLFTKSIFRASRISKV